MSKLLEYVTSSTNKKRALSVHVIIILRYNIFLLISTRSFTLEIRGCIFFTASINVVNYFRVFLFFDVF